MKTEPPAVTMKFQSEAEGGGELGKGVAKGRQPRCFERPQLLDVSGSACPLSLRLQSQLRGQTVNKWCCWTRGRDGIPSDRLGQVQLWRTSGC